MKIKSTLAVALLTFGVVTPVFGAEKDANINKFNDFDVRMLEVTDARDAQNPAFDEALAAGRWEALVYLGQIGGDACERIKPFLTHEDNIAREAAALGAAACYDNSFDALVVDSAGVEETNAHLVAMGFSGGDLSKKYLVEQINEMTAEANNHKCHLMDRREVALFALMQSIVYDRLEPTALPGLGLSRVLGLTADPCIGYKAAYLLGRFQKVDQHLGLPDVLAAMDAAPDNQVRRALVRVLRQFGNEASEALIGFAKSEDEALSMEAVRGLGSLSDEASRAYLVQTVKKGDVPHRHLALSALAGRHMNDEAITKLVQSHIGSENDWIAVTALNGLMQRAPEKAISIARVWFEGDDYYKAFSAMGVLAQSDEGKEMLQAFADANPNTIRGREAAIALDPSIEGVEKPRKTPSWNMVRSYQDRELALQTTRGPICIKPSSLAPYAAANFMLLADVGKMNGMLWQRVIPNFVAQAGQSEDPELANWGTIREEWWGSIHDKGSVGVATAGRDTGSAQFFINTAYNLHLNGRYTVMGHVISGMDAAMALQEGDVITRAETVPAGQCK